MENTMTDIGKRVRDDFSKMVDNFVEPCFTHVGIVEVDTYNKAFFSERHIAALNDLNGVVNVNRTQFNYEFGTVSIPCPLFAHPVHVTQQINYTHGTTTPIAWAAARAPCADVIAYNILADASREVYELAIDVAIFKYAAKVCGQKAKSFEQLGATFPPYAAILRSEGFGDQAMLCTQAKTIKPLPLEAHERAAVKYALNWLAVQNLIGTLKSRSFLQGSLRVNKASTSHVKVTFAGNDERMSMMI
jgi:hypothetical protein